MSGIVHPGGVPHQRREQGLQRADNTVHVPDIEGSEWSWRLLPPARGDFA